MQIGNRLKDKIAIVTGGSQGIGEAICHSLAKEGATVVVVNNSHPAAGLKVAQDIHEFGGKAEAYACDVADEQKVQNLVNHVKNKYDRVDIVINNAAILIFKSLEEHTLEDWDKMMNVNLKGPFLLSRAVTPIMKQQQYGKIIFISSMGASVGFAGASVYCATKGGLTSMTKTMVAELAPHGINVNLISPGNTATPLNEMLRKNPEFVKLMLSKTPAGVPYMKPTDLGGAAVYLASDEANAVHGLDLIVDNGWSAI